MARFPGLKLRLVRSEKTGLTDLVLFRRHKCVHEPQQITPLRTAIPKYRSTAVRFAPKHPSHLTLNHASSRTDGLLALCARSSLPSAYRSTPMYTSHMPNDARYAHFETGFVSASNSTIRPAPRSAPVCSTSASAY